jgi:hypothetical protein
MDDDIARAARPAGFHVAPLQLALAVDDQADAVERRLVAVTRTRRKIFKTCASN